MGNRSLNANRPRRRLPSRTGAKRVPKMSAILRATVVRTTHLVAGWANISSGFIVTGLHSRK
jgi:hypothetical protein